MTINRDTDSNHILRYLLLVLVIAIGAFLRFQAVQNTEVIGPLRADAGQYVSYAMNTLNHGVYSKDQFNSPGAPTPDAVRAPAYPIFLAAVLATSPGAPLVLIQYLQAALSTATILLSFLLFRRFLPPIWTNAVALLVAISPHLVIANVYILSESVFTFGLLASLLICARTYERGGMTAAFIAGAVFGLLTLTRAAVQYFILVLAAILRLEGKSVHFILTLVLGFALAFGAWSIRNVSSTGGMSDDTLKINFLHHGMYPDFKYQDQDHTYGFPYRHDPDSASISESTSTILYEILNRFSEEPGRHLRWFILGKPAAFWQWDIIQGMGDIYVYPVKSSPYFSRPVFQWTHSVAQFLHTPLVILGLLGSITCWFWSARLETRSAAFCVKLVAAMIIYYQLIHMIGAPFPRYSVPLRPLIYAMAAYFSYASTSLIYERFKPEEKVTQV